MNINARGCRLRQSETSLPFGGIIRIRFIGYDLNRATAQYPRCYVKLFLFHQTHLVESLPTLAGKVNPAVFGVVGDSVQYIRISVT